MTELSDVERTALIKTTTEAMLEEGKDLTRAGKPEMAVLRDLSGISDATTEERDAAYLLWATEDDAPTTPPPTGTTPRKSRRMVLPEHYPSCMYHPTEKSRDVANKVQARKAHEEGWRMPEDMDPDDWRGAWNRAADN